MNQRRALIWVSLGAPMLVLLALLATNQRQGKDRVQVLPLPGRLAQPHRVRLRGLAVLLDHVLGEPHLDAVLALRAGLSYRPAISDPRKPGDSRFAIHPPGPW